MQILSRNFFNHPTLTVAKELIGAYLVRETDGQIERHMITETEAYDGPQDLACHAARGRRTKRTEVLFGEAGIIYIYFTYGMHWLLNIVTGPKEFPAAVLIRGIDGTNGPARLTKKLRLDGTFHGKALGKETGLWIEKSANVNEKLIQATPRIGIDYSGPIWSKKKYRFVYEMDFSATKRKKHKLPATSPATPASTARKTSATATTRSSRNIGNNKRVKIRK